MTAIGFLLLVIAWLWYQLAVPMLGVDWRDYVGATLLVSGGTSASAGVFIWLWKVMP